MRRSIWIVVLFWAALAFFVGCEEEESECPECTGELAIIANSRGQDFDEVKCTITRHGVMVQSFDLLLSDGFYATSATLSIGSSYGVQIDGYQDSVLTYTGSETNITIEADWTTTTVVELLKIYNIVGSYATSGPTWGIAFAWDLVYLVGPDGMWVIGVGDPENPSAVAFIPAEISNDVCVQGNYAYVAFHNHPNWDSSGVKIIDISNPFDPVEVGFCVTGSIPFAVGVSGNYVYLADLQSEFGLSVIDVSQPENPVEVGRCHDATHNTRMAVSGDHVFLSNSNHGFSVVNVSDPADPQLVFNGDFYNGGGITVSDNYLYISTYEGLNVFDISDPENPVQTGVCNVSCSSIEIVGELAYAAAYDNGLRVIDVSDPTGPFESGFSDIPGIAYDISVAGNYAYIASDEAGLQIVYIGE
jgi:hypothetical protein